MKQVFDFLVLSCGRLATNSLWYALHQHPEIFLPLYQRSDELLRNDLLLKLFEYDSTKPKRLAGMMMHWPDVVFAETTPEIIRKVIQPNLLYQTVRNPYDLMLSQYNHTLHRSMIGWVEHPKSFEEFIQNEINLRLVRYFALGQRYADHFAHWRLIDFAHLTPNRMQSTLNQVFAEVGVDAYVCPPKVFAVRNDNVDSMLLIPLLIRNGNQDFKMLLTYKKFLAEYDNAYDVVLNVDPYQWDLNYFDDEIILLCSKEVTFNLHEKMFKKNCVGQVRLRLEYIEKTINQFKQDKLTEFPPVLRPVLRAAIAEDQKLLQKRFPDIQNYWEL
jgi:hypothetical protein